MALYLDITEDELERIYEEILTFMGAYTIEVDITKPELLIALRRSLEIFEKETSIWQIQNQFGNLYGLPASTQMTQQLATISFSIVNQISDWFASMGRYGGKVPWHKDYIILEEGRQIYNLSTESSKPYSPGTRRIHRVMWFAPRTLFNTGKYTPQNLHGDDVLYSNAWNFNNNWANYGNSRLGFLGTAFDTVMMMQSFKTRDEVYFSEFFYNLSGDLLELTPMPGVNYNSGLGGMRVFYYYWNEAEISAGTVLDEEGNVIVIDPVTGLPVGQGDLIVNPLNFNIEYIPWSKLSPWGRAWIFDYALAFCKYIQGSKWRKIKKTMGEGEMNYEIEFDYSSLLNESETEKTRLIDSLRSDLGNLNFAKIMQDKLAIYEAAKKINAGKPKIIKSM